MNSNFRLILASESPRRKQLMEEAGFKFISRRSGVDETYPEELPVKDVAKYLAEKKALVLLDELEENDLLLAADTVVLLGDRFLGKPGNEGEAKEMLSELSGRKHLVITGCCLLSRRNKRVFDETTEVEFKQLSYGEIEHYVLKYRPFDKAGAYGIQEWIGLIGIKCIRGSYFNVVGLPIQRVYDEIATFVP